MAAIIAWWWTAWCAAKASSRASGEWRREMVKQVAEMLADRRVLERDRRGAQLGLGQCPDERLALFQHAARRHGGGVRFLHRGLRTRGRDSVHGWLRSLVIAALPLE